MEPRLDVTDANDQGIGLPLDEAIIFWRRMYGASMTDDKFNKEYKYNIRHGYGQEGKRTNYPPKKWVPSFLHLH
jgi:DNA primase large subunit